MRLLAIDPGLRCGWALRDGELLLSGTWDLSGNRFEGAGFRYVRLLGYLREVGRVDQVFFEEVASHKGTAAAHSYGAITGVLMTWCEQNRIPYAGIPVGTIKRRATGKGNANKAAMLDAARRRWPEQEVATDDQADSLWLLECGLELVPAGEGR